MLKDKCKLLLDFLLKHSKIAFPVIICAAAALTVTAALRAGHADRVEGNGETEPVSTQGTDATIVLPEEQKVPLVENQDSAVSELILSYYNAMANGDMDTLTSLCDQMSQKEYFHFEEYSKYIDYYPTVEIYTKKGPEEGSTIAYVYYKTVFINHEEEFPGYQAYYICTKEDGSLYLKRGQYSDEVDEYIIRVNSEDDVIEFNNRITVEYNELLLEKPQLFEYLKELDQQVNTAVGERLSAAKAQEAAEQQAQAGEVENTGEGQGQQEPAVPETQYVTATTTVNVRSSDSENADRLGKVNAGEKLELLEQRVNGWSKVLFEGKEAYIKSEFLQLAESASGVETIGTVTATTNVNVRAQANQTSDILGIMAGGDTLDLVAEEGDWCKVKYDGQLGYVKAEYVEKN